MRTSSSAHENKKRSLKRLSRAFYIAAALVDVDNQYITISAS
jgi:hypothetical protein